jgi:hypothetical protein
VRLPDNPHTGFSKIIFFNFLGILVTSACKRDTVRRRGLLVNTKEDDDDTQRESCRALIIVQFPFQQSLPSL